MKRIFAILLALVAPTVWAQGTSSMKFENGGLKDRTVVELVINNNTLSGTYTIEKDYDATTAEKHLFTAVKTAPDKMEISFKDGKIPYELPKGATKAVWLFKGTQLIIPTQGMNYQTNQISNYDMAFDAKP
ncbi:hypothetical protein K1X76_10420 [bacterium]|nr:hypothetical protein [bacterium]